MSQQTLSPTRDVGADTSRRLIRTLSGTVFLQWMGATAIIPMLPVYIRHLGGSDALAGVVMAAFYAAGVLSQYPIGKVADRIGRRQVLLSGLVLYGLASFAFLLPISAPMAIVLRAMQGVGSGAATVAALAMISGSVAVERRGRAFASIYGGEIAGMAVGPLVGSIVGIRYMWAMFLGSGLLSIGACIPALRLHEARGAVEERADRTSDDGVVMPLEPVRVRRSMVGALICGAALGLTSGVYDICWTLLLLARGASGLEIGISWTLFAVPFVLVAKPSGWLADHLDRPARGRGGLGLSTALCASYPFIHNVPALIILGASEAMGFAAAMPAMQSLLTQGSRHSEVGRIQGMFGTSQTACTAVAAAGAGAAFAVAAWLPFVTVSAVVVVGLAVAAVVWRSVPGRVDHAGQTEAHGLVDAVNESVLAQAPVSASTGTGVSWDVQ
jgi:MFS family permease